MMPRSMVVGALVLGMAAALWAALLALASEAAAVRLGAPETSTRRSYRESVAGALLLSRLALLLIAGSGLAVGLGWWSRPLSESLGAVGLGVALLYLVADVLPRSLGLLAPRLADLALPIARKAVEPFRPLLGLLGGVERGLAFVVPPAVHQTHGPTPEERDILARVLALRETTVEDVMTPRLDVYAIDAEAGWKELVEHARRGGHARLPVYQGDLDTIVGVVYAKDLTAAVSGVQEPPSDWHELMRPPHFVPESKTLLSQLRAFQRGPSHLAIVVDEFGGTSGLVTLEDVLEEVVGEIRGEYDVDEEPEIELEGDDRFWVDGSVTVDQLAELLGRDIHREDVSTVGGLVYSELGRVPEPGEEFQFGDYRVVVERVVRRRIRRVYFERRGEAAPTEIRSEDRP